MDDPGELLRFWLQHRYHEQGFSVPKLAAALGVRAVTVGHWLRGRGAIRTKYWSAIATFFETGQPERLLTDARRLWALADNRRYYAVVDRELEPRRAPRPRHPARPKEVAAIR